MKPRTLQRIFFGIGMFFVLLYAPWWLLFLVAFAGAFHFPPYYEILVFGVLFDLLYGTAGGAFSGFGMIGLVASIIIFAAANKAHHELRT